MVLTGAEKTRRYREKHPQRARESLKRYWNKKYECECGSVLTNKHRPRHLKSEKHAFMMQYKEIKDKLETLEADMSTTTTTDEDEA